MASAICVAAANSAASSGSCHILVRNVNDKAITNLMPLAVLTSNLDELPVLGNGVTVMSYKYTCYNYGSQRACSVSVLRTDF